MIRVRFIAVILLLNCVTLALAGPSEDLLEAARNGEIDAVVELLAKGADVNAKSKSIDRAGRTALMFASEKGNLKLVQALLASGADVNMQDITGGTALQYAAISGNLNVVKVLLDKGADVNTKENTTYSMGRNALMFASENGHDDVVQLLFAHGAKINDQDGRGQTALIYASSEVHSKVVQLLLADRADVNIKSKSGTTALMNAAKNADVNIVNLLIANGADVNAKDISGDTALMNAAKNANVNMVNLLIANGAEVNAKDKGGSTALMHCWDSTYHYGEYPAVMQALIAKGSEVNNKDEHVIDAFLLAVAKGNLDVVQQLLAKGMDVNVKGRAFMQGEVVTYQGSRRRMPVSGIDAKINSESDATPLMLASISGNLNAVQMLLSSNASVDAKDVYGRTALMLAAENGFPDVVQALLARKADVNAKANDNTTALMAATQNNHRDVVKILRISGGAVNAQDAQGITMLMQAAKDGNMDVVQMMLDQGGDVNLKAYDGRTALMFACINHHLDVIQALLAKGVNVNTKDNQGASAIDMVAKDDTDAKNMLIKAGAVTMTKNPNWKGVWKGKLGKQEITACFQLDEGNLFQLGVYYYSKYRQPIQLDLDRDIVQADSSLMLHEANGAWVLTMSNNDLLTGTWSNKNKQYAMSLTRVPIANKDEVDEPCGSAEFNNARKIKPQFVTTTGTINGIQYRIVTDKNDEGIASFELIGTDKMTGSINQQLRKDLEATIDEAFDCANGVLGRFGEKGDYSSTTTPIFITKHWLSMAVSTDEFCGGAHPDGGTTYKLWDLDTGKPDDIWTWFNARGAQQRNGYFMQGPELANLLASLWPKSADSGADHECDDAEGMASWDIHPDATGLVFSPELPHVIQACAEDVIIPYKDLLPMLNEHGKAAAASIQADLAKQHTQGK